MKKVPTTKVPSSPTKPKKVVSPKKAKKTSPARIKTLKVFPRCRKGSNFSPANPKHAKSLKQIVREHIRMSKSKMSPKIKKATLNLFKALSKNKKCSLVRWRTDKDGHRYLRQSYKRRK